MLKRLFFLSLISSLISSCDSDGHKVLSAFDVYCEMVANDAKPLALHYPMTASEVDYFWSDFISIANKYKVELYKEDEFPETLLFPANLTKGKTIVVIFKQPRLEQYNQIKNDLKSLTSVELDQQIEISRRFGRLLGYSPIGINKLLSKSSDFRSLASTNVKKQITHLYYENIEEAIDFYEKTLGLKKLDESTIQISSDAFIQLHTHNELHPKGQTKSTAIALLTDQLPQWYKYIQDKNIPVKYTYKPKEGGPHDGFVAIDPGGYLLEFEQFKIHSENELFMAVLSTVTRINTSIDDLSFFGSITWTYHNDLLLVQNFYNDELGFEMVADQGWTKIFQTSSSGFIGLVDERRGMEDYDQTKAVEIEWQVENTTDFGEYANQYWKKYNYDQESFLGPEQYIYHLSL